MPRFVVHEHHARNLHWDLRLELDGVLKSWALPKIPPQQKGEKRLAVAVDDHALSYLDYEGHIAEGYGEGDVLVWDSGHFELKERAPGKLVVELEGEKLRGGYVLLVPRWSKSGKAGGSQWLFLKAGGPEPAQPFGPRQAPRSAAQAARVRGTGAAPSGKAAAPRRKKKAVSSRKRPSRKKPGSRSGK